MSDHRTIYLEPICPECGEPENRQWCEDDVWSSLCENCHGEVSSPEYILKSEYDDIEAVAEVRRRLINEERQARYAQQQRYAELVEAARELDGLHKSGDMDWLTPSMQRLNRALAALEMVDE